MNREIYDDHTRDQLIDEIVNLKESLIEALDTNDELRVTIKHAVQEIERLNELICDDSPGE